MNPFMNADRGEERFKTTKLWNEVVYAFCVGMPVKRRRRNLRVYDDTFRAKDAVNWCHAYLAGSVYFNHHQVSRFQAVLLLRKFLQWEIIKRADGKEDEEFQDNRDLYSFTNYVHENMPVQPPPPTPKPNRLQRSNSVGSPLKSLSTNVANLRSRTLGRSTDALSEACVPVSYKQLQTSLRPPIRGDRPPPTAYTLPRQSKIRSAHVVRLGETSIEKETKV